MPASLDGQLVVAISSRALFDFEEENEVFANGDDRAYMRLQFERLNVTAKPGVAFSLVNKLLAFNRPGESARVEVVILSRNDPVSGMRVFRSAKHHGLPIQRGVFTRGRSPWRYLKPLNANLFLSANEADVRSALDAAVPAARVYPHSKRASNAHPDEVRIAFDGDAVNGSLWTVPWEIGCYLIMICLVQLGFARRGAGRPAGFSPKPEELPRGG
jgi:5'-nucleotidase